LGNAYHAGRVSKNETLQFVNEAIVAKPRYQIAVIKRTFYFYDGVIHFNTRLVDFVVFPVSHIVGSIEAAIPAK
jgi:hypothetical protein